MSKWTSAKRLATNAVAAGGRSLAEKAYHRLRLAIVECQLAPGERLTEAAIAQRLRVGKTPAREALRRLVLEGLAGVTPRHGYTVAPITLRDVQELFDLRLLLEPAAAALAAGHREPAALSRLRKLSRLWAWGSSSRSPEGLPGFIRGGRGGGARSRPRLRDG
jgi:DNA-binding GntR family transcriptional regulator